MEWYENTGDAVAQLFWERPGTEPQIIGPGPLQPPREPDGFGTIIWAEAFEHYTNDVGAGQAVFQTWIGGGTWPSYPGPAVPSNDTGSIIGHDIWSPDTPYASVMETEIVFSGRQSLPLYYSDDPNQISSEADFTWETSQDWAAEGIDRMTLSLQIHGRPENGLALLYVEIEDEGRSVGVVEHPNLDLLLAPEWTEWRIPLASFAGVGVNLAAVTRISIGIRSPVVGMLQNDERPVGSRSMRLAYVDDVALESDSGPDRVWLEGCVWEEGTDDPIGEANVMFVRSISGSTGITATTSEWGDYSKRVTKDAPYFVSVTAEGYEMYTEPAPIVFDSATLMDFWLDPVEP
jgi:hypothetical protein